MQGVYLIYIFFADCADFKESCKSWKSSGYCRNSSEYFEYVTNQCPKSCNICTSCPTPPPTNTQLPPTELTCTKGKIIEFLKKCFTKMFSEFMLCFNKSFFYKIADKTVKKNYQHHFHIHFLKTSTTTAHNNYTIPFSKKNCLA